MVNSDLSPRYLPVFRSVLRADTLAQQVLPFYTLGDRVSCTFYQRGINDLYSVQTVQGRWMLRITAANGSDPAAVQSEIAMLRHLDAAGIAVAAPVARQDGAYLTQIAAPEGERTAVLFDFVEGSPPEANNPVQARNFGAALARMHIAADRYPADIQRPLHDRRYFVDEPLARLRDFAWFASYSAELAYIQEAAPALWTQAATLPQHTPVYGFCHGDALRGNALYGDDVTLLDFDYSGLGWRVYDLATYLWLEIIDGPALDWSKQAVHRALLEGYQSVRPLSAAEIEALPVFAALRQIFLFGAAIKHAAAFGAAWMNADWLARMVEFIRLCRDGQWLARVGL